VTRYAAEPLDRGADRLSAPPVGARSRARRVAPPLLLAGGVLAASVALHLRDPHQSGTWGFCPWLVVTGTACPGCGGLRAVNDLTHGDVAAAFSSNALFVTSLPLLAVLWTRTVAHRWRDERTPLPPAFLAWGGGAALVLLLAFWVVRNLPFASYLAP
jgi:acetyl esterase/lipase